MGEYVATEILKLMVLSDITVKKAKVLMLGITFKENCPDIRNTKAIDVYKSLNQYGMEVDIYDPWADNDEVLHEYGIEMIPIITSEYDVIVHVVAHKEFEELNFNAIKKENGVVYDVKGSLPKQYVSKRL